MQPPSDTKFHVRDEVQIQDLLAIGAKEALRIQALFETGQRASEKRLPAPPCEPDIVALGREQAYFAQRYEPAVRAIPDKDLLQCFAGLRRRGSGSYP